jgi:transcriptional regulator with XRE-family HTH domain
MSTMTAAHDPQYIELIARLRNARKVKKLSQKELGDLLNKPQSFVSKVETCERRIDVIEAAQWCIALGIALEDVLPPSVKKALEDASERAR